MCVDVLNNSTHWIHPLKYQAQLGKILPTVNFQKAHFADSGTMPRIDSRSIKIVDGNRHFSLKATAQRRVGFRRDAQEMRPEGPQDHSPGRIPGFPPTFPGRLPYQARPERPQGHSPGRNPWVPSRVPGRLPYQARPERPQDHSPGRIPGFPPAFPGRPPYQARPERPQDHSPGRIPGFPPAFPGRPPYQARPERPQDHSPGRIPGFLSRPE